MAAVLGETSPKMSTVTVMTTVEIKAPFWSFSPSTNSRVDNVVATMLTMLLPTRMVEIRLS